MKKFISALSFLIMTLTSFAANAYISIGGNGRFQAMENGYFEGKISNIRYVPAGQILNGNLRGPATQIWFDNVYLVFSNDSDYALLTNDDVAIGLSLWPLMTKKDMIHVSISAHGSNLQKEAMLLTAPEISITNSKNKNEE
jgi:hypothetical protein